MMLLILSFSTPVSHFPLLAVGSVLILDFIQQSASEWLFGWCPALLFLWLSCPSIELGLSGTMRGGCKKFVAVESKSFDLSVVGNKEDILKI